MSLKKDEVDPPKSGYAFWSKVGALLLLIGVIGVTYWQFGGILSFEYLAQRETRLRSFQADFPIISAALAIALYVAVAGLSLPGAAVLSIACGWFFGFWEGLLVVSFGSAGGATLAFLMRRYLFRDWLQRSMQKRLSKINAAFETEGAFYLFSLRLVPVVPFFVINAMMGLTKIRVFTFWWVSQIGMLPGTAAYVYAGSTVPSLQVLAKEGARGIVSWQLVLALAIVGLLPLVVKKSIAFFLKHPHESGS
ncbi:MAG: TVP38/TMEM64 family protein [Pirellulaceae bacterium]|nr:TVP38/TMEM64 family protein [Pirellulaceae bacterium]